MTRILHNSEAKAVLPGLPPGREPMEYHRKLPQYAPTPLKELPQLAKSPGVGQIWAKEESFRLGLPAFKILGASWAIWKLFSGRFHLKLSQWQDIDELRKLIEPHKPLKFVAATDGNHGRGVARMGKLLGLETQIFIPQGTALTRIQAIENEGARVTVIDGGHDEAVRKAAQAQDQNTFLIQDTSWKGYERITEWVIEGYSTMMWEIEDTCFAENIPPFDIIIVQIGVGALGVAVVNHFKRLRSDQCTKIIGVEPLNAACAFSAVEAGRIVSLPGKQDSIMAGLNCGALATVAWEAVRYGIDCFAAIEDDFSRQAMRTLAEVNIRTSESGAAGLAGLTAILNNPQGDNLRQIMGINQNSRILLFITEGVTDPISYDEIVIQGER